MRRLFATLMVMFVLSGTAMLLQQEPALAQKEKDKKEDGFKDEWPKIKEGTVVKIVKVDIEKKTVDVQDASGKKMSLTVTADTMFAGPRGGKSSDKIKDDRFVAGNICKIVTDKSGKSLMEVHLATRDNSKEKMEDEKKKPEDEKKKVDEKKKPEDEKKKVEEKKKPE